MTPHSELTVRPTASTMRAERKLLMFGDNKVERFVLVVNYRGKQSVKKVRFFPILPSKHWCAMAEHQGILAAEGRGNAPLLLSLLTGAFAAWCQRPVVITRLSLSYHYTNVPPALVCQLSSVIRLRAATGQ